MSTPDASYLTFEDWYRSGQGRMASSPYELMQAAWSAGVASQQAEVAKTIRQREAALDACFRAERRERDLKDELSAVGRHAVKVAAVVQAAREVVAQPATRLDLGELRAAVATLEGG